MPATRGMTIPAAMIVKTTEIPETFLTPESSRIHSIGYDEGRQLLVIRFKNSENERAYGYPEFTREQWAAMQAADSWGSYFERNIRKAYPQGTFLYLPGLKEHP